MVTDMCEALGLDPVTGPLQAPMWSCLWSGADDKYSAQVKRLLKAEDGVEQFRAACVKYSGNGKHVHLITWGSDHARLPDHPSVRPAILQVSAQPLVQLTSHPLSVRTAVILLSARPSIHPTGHPHVSAWPSVQLTSHPLSVRPAIIRLPTSHHPSVCPTIHPSNWPSSVCPPDHLSNCTAILRLSDWPPVRPHGVRARFQAHSI